MFSKGQTFLTTIESLAFQGHGIAKPNGVTVFVPRTVPGDKVEIKITNIKKSFAFGQCIKVIEPSPHRITPKCPYFERCGGCQYQNMQDAFIAQQKIQQLRDIFARMGPGDTVIEPLIIGQKRIQYRNRISFRRDENATQGFISLDDYTTLDIDHCLIADPKINEIWHEIKPFIANINAKVMPFVTLRLVNDEVVVIFATTKAFNKNELIRRFQDQPYKVYTTTINEKKPQAIGKDLLPLFEDPIYLEENIHRAPYIVRPDLFFQTNIEIAEKMMTHISNKISQAPSRALDLYCGSGLFSIMLAKLGFDVLGIEVQYPAVKCAKQTALVHGVEEKTQFQTGKALTLLERLIEKQSTFPLTIVDPPRAGLHKDIIPMLSNIGTKQLVYVSCDPTTLARDTKRLNNHGFELKSVTPFEMFPQTYHIECIAIMQAE